MIRNYDGTSYATCGKCLKQVEIKLYEEIEEADEERPEPEPTGLKRLFTLFKKKPPKKSDLDRYRSIEPSCPSCSGKDFLGLNKFDCPKCGGKIVEDEDSRVMI